MEIKQEELSEFDVVNIFKSDLVEAERLLGIGQGDDACLLLIAASRSFLQRLSEETDFE